MESPFAKPQKTIVLYLEPILNTYYKTYQNIITLSAIPDGPLEQMVTMISTTKLSPFQDANTYSSPQLNSGLGGGCIYVLLRYPKQGGGMNWKNSDTFMGADDITSVFSYLQTNGYKIDTELTKMMNKSRVTIGGVSEQRFSGDRRMICMFTGPTL
jgi:hypothetical protein